jgi:hypothetical protein
MFRLASNSDEGQGSQGCRASDDDDDDGATVSAKYMQWKK